MPYLFSTLNKFIIDVHYFYKWFFKIFNLFQTYMSFYFPIKTYQLACTCSKLTIETLTGIFIVNFEHISHLVLVFPLLTLNM